MTRPVLVAPDKFKGTLDAAQVAAAIGRGLLAGGVEDVALLPIADGGEGTMEAIVRARGGRILGAGATDALGRRGRGGVRDPRRRPRRGRRTGAGLGAVAPARSGARRGGGLESRHR